MNSGRNNEKNSHTFFKSKHEKLDYNEFKPQALSVLKTMSLEDKIGQMTLPSIDFIRSSGGLVTISRCRLGGLLAEGNTTPGESEAEGYDLKTWQKLMRNVREQKVTTKAGIQIGLLCGTDAIRGDQHVQHAVLFPHHIGLGATHDAELIKKIAAWTAFDVTQSGFNWIFAPAVDVPYNQLFAWGRTYECFSGNPQETANYALAYVEGSQQLNGNKIKGVLATGKHWIGAGNTKDGVDNGDVVLDNETEIKQFFNNNYPGFKGAFDASVGSVMVSYSRINGTPMSIQKPYLTDYLRREFSGFTVSDYGAISKVADIYTITYIQALANAINSGIDMIMLGPAPDVGFYYKTIEDFQALLLKAVRENLIKEDRIDEAVTRILQVKFAMGLIGDDIKLSEVSHSEEDEKELALLAAQKSLVLLKNEKRSKTGESVLPIQPSTLKHVILLGEQGKEYDKEGDVVLNNTFKFDSIGDQCGGWRIKWQGLEGNQFTDERASSILTGVQKTLDKANIYQNPNMSRLDTILEDADIAKNTIVIVVLAEFPYAEFMGDIGNQDVIGARYADCLSLNPYAPRTKRANSVMNYDAETLKVIDMLKGKGVPIITVILSGRPMIIDESSSSPLPKSDAVIAAWLPGTTGGEAIANAIFGKYRFGHDEQANTLPVSWPSIRMLQTEQTKEVEGEECLFKPGFGYKT